MKKYWKWIVLVLVIIVAIIGVILYRRDSRGKPFKASLNTEKAMMGPDWYATVKLKANPGAKYSVENKDGKVINGTKTTKSGKADIRIGKAGSFVVIAKSDNGHVTKKLPVKVTYYKKNINKETNKVGPMSFKIKKIEYSMVTKGGESTINNVEAYNTLHKHFYRITVYYTAINHSKYAISSLGSVWSPVIDGNRAISVDNSDGTSYAESSIRESGVEVPAHGKTEGTFKINSNEKLTVKNLKIHTNQFSADNDDKYFKGGTAKLE
ncbi:MAG: hypothetical protein H9W80_13110 [Enterococcus sp.]|nr:hypothetical protein [Enterococcus sp.]